MNTNTNGSPMTWIDHHIATCPSDASNAFEVIVQAEGWRSIPRFYQDELGSVVELEPQALCGMVSRIAQLVNTRQVALNNADSAALSDQHAFSDDDVAMTLQFGKAIADRNPIVSFWSFATLLSLRDSPYHEAKNYWLSAAASIVNMSRRRTAFVRCAYINLLVSATRRPVDGRDDVVLLPVYEILLESTISIGPNMPHSHGSVPAHISSLLASSLPLAVEDDAALIARGAFPLIA